MLSVQSLPLPQLPSGGGHHTGTSRIHGGSYGLRYPRITNVWLVPVQLQQTSAACFPSLSSWAANARDWLPLDMQARLCTPLALSTSDHQPLADIFFRLLGELYCR